MLIVITPEQQIADEARVINLLFNNGLETLHLRKPTGNIDEYKNLLMIINDKYHNKVVVHQYHQLFYEFNLKGIHLTEPFRTYLGDKVQSYLNDFKEHRDNCSVSSSFHDDGTLQNCGDFFDYHFLSPVYASISKQCYPGKGFDVRKIDKKTIGLGGISESTILPTMKKGYDGIAVLGAVWQNKQYLQNFLNIKSMYSRYFS